MSVETVLLVLLIVLVAGLLRSNAEILRRLGPPGEADGTDEVMPPPAAPPRAPGARAAPLTGPTLTGDVVSLDFEAGGGGPTLLAFLTSGCSTCAGFWETLGERRLPPGVRTVVVTHGADRERLTKLAQLAPAGVPVVMSSQAWDEYAVPGSPYFVLVDGAIRGEGAATSWSALSSLVSDAIEDSQQRGGTARAHRVDRTLEASGIGPDHPSLYPALQERE
ncbi:MAG TPA: hypothetical protein VGH45_07600 [Solirubrobacteraceae bacterium]